MSERLVSDRGYVLHSRPYRETSALVDVFTQAHGRVAAIARGVRGGGKRVRAVQPFVTLAVTWDGAGELRNLRGWESERSLWLSGDALAAGMYLNELLMRLLAREDPHPTLFAGYHTVLTDLQSSSLEPALRCFERLLLAELGYALSFTHTSDDAAPIVAGQRYRLLEQRGFVALEAGEYRGGELLAIGAGNYAELGTRRAAKRIFRELLAAQLGPRPLVSRQMFAAGRTRGTKVATCDE